MAESEPIQFHGPITQEAPRRHLRLAEGSADLFPRQLDTLSPEVIWAHDRRGLLIMGALGFEQSFDTLDSWLRYSHREGRRLQTELQRNPRSTFAAIQTAARYVVSRANVIVPNYDHTKTPDPNRAVYERVPKYRELAAEAQRNPQDKYSLRRVHLARISIFGEALFKSKISSY